MKIQFSDGGFLPKKTAFFVVLTATLLVFTMTTMLILSRFKPVFEKKASDAAKIKATSVLNKAVNDVFKDINSSEFVNITRDGEGNVKSVTADTVAMNKMRSAVAEKIQSYTDKNEDLTVTVPVGSLTRYSVLQGVGYRIPIKVTQEGIAIVDFKDEFTQSGINQVKHKIYITASANINIASSVMATSETVTVEIPVAETVIIGDVPNYFGEKLNVVGR